MVNRSRSAISGINAPVDNRASFNCSIAARRSSLSRARTGSRPSRSTSAYGSPRHIARASVSRSHEDPWLVRSRLLERRVEHRRIDADVAQRVPARQRHDVRPAQQLAQLGDVLLHHLAGRWGSGTPPELVDDAVRRDHFGRVRREQRQEIAQFGPPDRERLTRAEDHHRAQHPHLQPRHRQETYRYRDRPISGFPLREFPWRCLTFQPGRPIQQG